MSAPATSAPTTSAVPAPAAVQPDLNHGPLPLAEQLCFAVYAAGHAMNRVYRPLLEPLGLTYPQYLVLLALWELDHETVKALGERLFLDSGTLTPLLKRMETAGLVARRRDAVDERLVRVSLTEAGRAMRDRAVAVQRSVFRSCGMDADKVVALRDALTGLRAALTDRSGSAD